MFGTLWYSCIGLRCWRTAKRTNISGHAMCQFYGDLIAEVVGNSTKSRSRKLPTLPRTPFSVNFSSDLRLRVEARGSIRQEHGLCSRVAVAPRRTHMENGSVTGRS